MKKLILIFLLIDLFLSLSGQTFDNIYVKERKIPEAVKVITVYTSSIILNAVGDGLNDSGEKQWGHLCNAVSTGLLLASPFIIDYEKAKWLWYLTSYTSLRIAFFDYSYNLTRGLPLNYIGGTSTWDKILGKMNPPNTYLGRGVVLIVGISIPINELKRK